MAAGLSKAAGAVGRILLPRLDSIDGELKAINVKIDSLDLKIDTIKSELRAEIKVVDAKVDHLDGKLDMDRRMAPIIETMIKQLEKAS